MSDKSDETELKQEGFIYSVTANRKLLLRCTSCTLHHTTTPKELQELQPNLFSLVPSPLCVSMSDSHNVLKDLLDKGCKILGYISRSVNQRMLDPLLIQFPETLFVFI